MVLTFKFRKVKVGIEAWVIDSKGVRHRIKGIYPTRKAAEEEIVRLLEREEMDMEDIMDKIGSPEEWKK